MKKSFLAIALSLSLVLSSTSVYAEVDDKTIEQFTSEETLEMGTVNTEESFSEDTISESVSENEIQEISEESDLLDESETVSDEEIIESLEDAKYLSEFIEYENPIGEIKEGQKLELEYIAWGMEAQATFVVPETKRYRIYTTYGFEPQQLYQEYNDSITVFKRNNEVINPSDDDSWYLSKGDTITINVTFDKEYDYRYYSTYLNVIDYVGIKSITADLPENVLKTFSSEVLLHLHYSNNEQMDLKVTASPVTTHDPLLGMNLRCSMDSEGNISCTIGKDRVIPLGKTTIFEWTDPHVYQVSKVGSYTVKKNELYNSKYFCLSPVIQDASQYYVTVSGNKSNDFSMYGFYDSKGVAFPNYTDKGVQIIINLQPQGSKEYENSMIAIQDDSDNTSYTITVEKVMKAVPTSINLDQKEFKTDGDMSFSGTVCVDYEDGTSELVPFSISKDVWQQTIPLKNKQSLDISLLNNHGMNVGAYSVRAMIYSTVLQKDVIVFPKDYKDGYDASVNLNESVRNIDIPELEDNENYIVRINSLVDRYYELNTEDHYGEYSLRYSLFEEKDNTLIPCYTAYGFSEYPHKIHFEAGHTYYLLCSGTIYPYQEITKLPRITISLDPFYYEMTILNLPSNITDLSDLEKAEIHVKQTYGDDIRLPLIKDGRLTDDINVWGSVTKYDHGQWLYCGLQEEDFWNYLTTGELSGFVGGDLYRYELNTDFACNAYIEFIPKGEKVNITGMVTGSSGNLRNTNIEIAKGSSVVKATASSNGNYSISGLAAGNYILRFSSEGYITKEIPVEIGTDTVTHDVILWKTSDAAALCEASLSLEGQIGVNLIVNISEAMLKDSGAYAELTQEGSSNAPRKMKLTDATVDSTTGNRVFTYPVAAKEINDKITIRFYSANGEQLPLRGKMDRSVELKGNEFSYAATDYIDAKKNTSGTVGSLMKALDDYGTAAEKYFQYGEMGSDGISADLSAVTQTKLSPYRAVASGERLDGVSVSASLMLESMTSINVNYAISTSLSDYTFTCDGNAVTPEKAGKEYQITVSDIAAKDLDQMHEFSITDKSGKTQTVKYSALSYAYSKVNSTGDVSTVAKTLYLYNQAAKGYFGA